MFEDNIFLKINHCFNCQEHYECQSSWCPKLKRKINNIINHSNYCSLPLKDCQFCQLLIPLTIFTNEFSQQYYFNNEDPVKQIDRSFFILGRRYRDDTLDNHCSKCNKSDCILKTYQQQLPILSINYFVLLILLYKIVDKPKSKHQIKQLYNLFKKEKINKQNINCRLKNLITSDQLRIVIDYMFPGFSIRE